LPDVASDPASSRPSRPHPTKATPPAAASDLSAELRALEKVRVAIAEHRTADAREGVAAFIERRTPVFVHV
jgi:hypothetical protein